MEWWVIDVTGQVTIFSALVNHTLTLTTSRQRIVL